MPNTGRPSRDCYLCRSRRVKCDLGKPSCRRCQVYGASCPGYREEADLVFQNQDIRVPRRPRKKREPNKKKPTVSHRPQGRIPESSPDKPRQARDTPAHLGTQDKITPSIPQVVPPVHPQFSTAVVLNQFSSRSRRYAALPLGIMEFLPRIYSDAAPESCFRCATDAFAYAFLRHQQNDSIPDAKDLAIRYSKALVSTNMALRDPRTALHDDTIMAVWFLGAYEVQVASAADEHSPGPAAYHAHTQGLMSLLNARGMQQLFTKQGRNIFWLTFAMVFSRSVLWSVPCPEDCRRWLKRYAALKLPEDDMTGHHVYTYLVDSLHLTWRMERAMRNKLGDLTFAKFLDIKVNFDDLDGREISPKLEFAKLQAMGFWIQFCASRARHHQVMINFTAFAERSTCSPLQCAELLRCRERSITVISNMAQEVSKCVDVENRSVSWSDLGVLWCPLTILASLPSIPRKESEKFIAALDRLGREVGILAVLLRYPVAPPVAVDG